MLITIVQYPGMAVFPKVWKTAAICLLYEGFGKPLTEPGSFRPISLLDRIGKVYERLLLNRVAVDIGSRLVPNQYGFHSGRGTVDAVSAVIDIAKDAAKSGGPE